jgi:hypothetical protein
MNEIEGYLRARLDELRCLAQRGDPWVFLCASSFLEYLARLEKGGATNAGEYKSFLRKYLYKVCPLYGRFRYRSGAGDMADQMYHVLRCGIVHGFSLVADATAKKHGGWDRSILLAHRSSGQKHLSPYVNNRVKPKVDAVIFVAEDFVEDIAKLAEFLFRESRKKAGTAKTLRQNMRNWFTQYPPIGIRMFHA